MKTTKSILDPNLGVFVQTVIDHALQGWTIQEANPPTLLGFCYETVMERDEDIVDPPAKLTREEIAAKARAALAEKRAAKKAAEAPSVVEPVVVSEDKPAETVEQPEVVSEEGTQISDKTDDQQRSEAEATGA